MNTEEELQLLVSTLTEKGYDGFFMSRSPSVGKLAAVAAEYFRKKESGKTKNSEGLWLSTYIGWKGEDKPNVVCDMWLSDHQGKIMVDKMIIEMKSKYGILINRCEFKNLTLDKVPTVQKALDLVDQKLANRAQPEKKRGLGL